MTPGPPAPLAEGAGGGLAWDGRQVCVAGLGAAGPPAARALAARGAQVTVLDTDGDEVHVLAASLRRIGITVLLGPAAAAAGLPAGTELVVAPESGRADPSLLAAAAAAGIPVIGDAELAWRLRPVFPDRAGPPGSAGQAGSAVIPGPSGPARRLRPVVPGGTGRPGRAGRPDTPRSRGWP